MIAALALALALDLAAMAARSSLQNATHARLITLRDSPPAAAAATGALLARCTTLTDAWA